MKKIILIGLLSATGCFLSASQSTSSSTSSSLSIHPLIPLVDEALHHRALQPLKDYYKNAQAAADKISRSDNSVETLWEELIGNKLPHAPHVRAVLAPYLEDKDDGLASLLEDFLAGRIEQTYLEEFFSITQPCEKNGVYQHGDVDIIPLYPVLSESDLIHDPDAMSMWGAWLDQHMTDPMFPSAHKRRAFTALKIVQKYRSDKNTKLKTIDEKMFEPDPEMPEKIDEPDRNHIIKKTIECLVACDESTFRTTLEQFRSSIDKYGRSEVAGLETGFKSSYCNFKTIESLIEESSPRLFPYRRDIRGILLVRFTDSPPDRDRDRGADRAQLINLHKSSLIDTDLRPLVEYGCQRYKTLYGETIDFTSIHDNQTEKADVLKQEPSLPPMDQSTQTVAVDSAGSSTLSKSDTQEVPIQQANDNSKPSENHQDPPAPSWSTVQKVVGLLISGILLYYCAHPENTTDQAEEQHEEAHVNT